MSEDIDMKIGPVAKLEKKQTKERQKKFDDYVMPTICDVIFFSNLEKSRWQIPDHSL